MAEIPFLLKAAVLLSWLELMDSKIHISHLLCAYKSIYYIEKPRQLSPAGLTKRQTKPCPYGRANVTTATVSTLTSSK